MVKKIFVKINSTVTSVFSFTQYFFMLTLVLYVTCLCINSMKGNCFFYDIRFHGVNFPASGPVMQRKTVRWEPSTERMYVRDGVLKGDVAMALLVEGGGHYGCDFKTIYK